MIRITRVSSYNPQSKARKNEKNKEMTIERLRELRGYRASEYNELNMFFFILVKYLPIKLITSNFFIHV